MFWTLVLMVSCTKLLLIPAYRSTDFEVHRNWLAITHSLPIRQWYYEATSEWTLDYPPLFAWFEYFLSQIAVFFDPKMLQVKNLNYASYETIVFQRISVIVADLVFAYGIQECCQYLSGSGVRKSSRWGLRWGSPPAILQLLLLGNAGLIIVDHIHFQYNGFLFGVLLLSVARILQGRSLEGAFWFAVLLNLKHIFAYIAPAYAVYLLRNYCFVSAQGHRAGGEPVRWRGFSPMRLARLAAVVTAVFLVSFGPFIVMGQLGQVLSRLFPFKRGLSHAYWAPNFWALYNMADKVLTILAKAAGLQVSGGRASMTGGLVQQYQHAVLPTVPPLATFVLTLVSILPSLVKLWRCAGNPLHFVRCLVLCALSAFMFGWHVHEKAILIVIIPLTLLAVVWRKEAQVYLLLSTVGHFSLFPLIFTPLEDCIKVVLFLLHTVYAFQKLSSLFNITEGRHLPLLSAAESLYVFSLGGLFMFQYAVFSLVGLTNKYPFLPLMLTSVHCAVGVLYCWLRYYYHFLTMDETNRKRKAY